MKKTLGLLSLFILVLSGCGVVHDTSSMSSSSESSSLSPVSTSKVDEQIYQIYQLYLSNGGTQTYEEWLASIKGKDGKDGHSPVVVIGDNGNWYIDGVDTRVSATGEKGDKGDTGKDGIDGKDGSKVLTGLGVPSNALGKDNDSYINLENWDYYVKVSGAWVKQGNIKGAPGEAGPQGEQGETGSAGKDGIDGLDGTAVLTGRGEPSSSLGNIGDSFIDLNTWDYYVKTSSGWVRQGNIKGADGENGNNGKSAYEIALDNGFIGTEKEWLESLKGEDGSRGNDGNTPFVGANGNWWIGDVDTGVKAETNQDSQGLEFYLTDDNTYYVGVGNAKYLKKIVIPSSFNGLPVVGIADEGFENARANEITLPDSIRFIGGDAFNHYRSLYTINYYGPLDNWLSLSGKTELAYAVNEIHLYLEGNKEETTSITIPDGTTDIHEAEFAFCQSLTSVDIPDSVTSIGEFAFHCCSLASIVIPDGVTTIGRGAFTSGQFTSVTIPSGVTTINEGVFGGCQLLTSIVIPDGVTTINNHAFSGCKSLTSIVIPNTVTLIGDQAFSKCTSLESITFLGTMEQWNCIVKFETSIYGCSAGTVVHCTDGDIELPPY